MVVKLRKKSQKVIHLQTKAKLKMRPLVTVLNQAPREGTSCTFHSVDETLACDHSNETELLSITFMWYRDI